MSRPDPELMLEGNWVRVAELWDDNGDPTLVVTHSPGMTPWSITALLGAAGDYHRELTKNIFFSMPCSGECQDDEELEEFEQDFEQWLEEQRRKGQK